MEAEDRPDFNSYTPDGLAELWRENPVLFKEIAATAIRKACTGSTPEQTLRLRQMQWVIDANLRKGTTPLARMHIMENIFYGRVFGDRGYLEELKNRWHQVAGVVTERDGSKKAGAQLVKNSGRPGDT